MEKTRKENEKNRWTIIYISLAIMLFLIGFYGFFSVLNKDTIYTGEIGRAHV